MLLESLRRRASRQGTAFARLPVMKDKHNQRQSAPAAPEHQAKGEAAAKPARDDVHEQREAGQQAEAVVKEAPRRTMQSQLELDRASDEGMTPPELHSGD
jgi:hypothetical protein